MLTKVTRHLSNSCVRSASCTVTVEAAYWSSQAEILSRHFHNSIWHNPTTKRINNIRGIFLFICFWSKGLAICDGFWRSLRTGRENIFIICYYARRRCLSFISCLVKRGGALWLPSFIVITSLLTSAVAVWEGDVGHGCHTSCCAHRRSETISGFYFGVVWKAWRRSLPFFHPHAVQRPATFEPSANDNLTTNFEISIRSSRFFVWRVLFLLSFPRE